MYAYIFLKLSEAGTVIHPCPASVEQYALMHLFRPHQWDKFCILETASGSRPAFVEQRPAPYTILHKWFDSKTLISVTFNNSYAIFILQDPTYSNLPLQNRRIAIVFVNQSHRNFFPNQAYRKYLCRTVTSQMPLQNSYIANVFTEQLHCKCLCNTVTS